LAKWIDKEIAIEPDLGEIISRGLGRSDKIIPRLPDRHYKAILRHVNSFWTTFEFNNQMHSEPLDKILLSWEDKDNVLKILVRP